MKLLSKITTIGIVGIASVMLLAGCQHRRSASTTSTTSTTTKKVPVSFVASSYKQPRVWYTVGTRNLGQNNEDALPIFVSVIKDGKAKVYSTADDSTEYDYDIDAQYKKQGKFSSIGDYAKSNPDQVEKRLKTVDKALYDINKMERDDMSHGQDHVKAYQQPTDIVMKTTFDENGETVTIKNGLRPDIMVGIQLGQDVDADVTYSLGQPISKPMTINHQKFIGYKSQDGNLYYLTKLQPNDHTVVADTSSQLKKINK